MLIGGVNSRRVLCFVLWYCTIEKRDRIGTGFTRGRIGFEMSERERSCQFCKIDQSPWRHSGGDHIGECFLHFNIVV